MYCNDTTRRDCQGEEPQSSRGGGYDGKAYLMFYERGPEAAADMEVGRAAAAGDAGGGSYSTDSTEVTSGDSADSFSRSAETWSSRMSMTHVAAAAAQEMIRGAQRSLNDCVNNPGVSSTVSGERETTNDAILDTRPSPLQNDGNSCYLNATLQGIWACKLAGHDLRARYTQLRPQTKTELAELITSVRHTREPLKTQVCLDLLMCEAYRSAIVPPDTRSVRPVLLLHAYHFAKDGGSMYQQDAHEFLAEVLNAGERDLSKGADAAGSGMCLASFSKDAWSLSSRARQVTVRSRKD